LVGVDFTTPYKDAFGWSHILERHYPDIPTLNSKGTLYPKVSYSEIQNLVFETINGTTPVNLDEIMIFEKTASFSNLTSATLRVVTEKNGKIISAYPTKTPR